MRGDEDAFSLEKLEAYPAGNAQRGREPPREVTAARYVLRAMKLELRRIVGVGGTRHVPLLVVISGARVGIADDGGERRAARAAAGQP